MQLFQKRRGPSPSKEARWDLYTSQNAYGVNDPLSAGCWLGRIGVYIRIASERRLETPTGAAGELPYDGLSFSLSLSLITALVKRKEKRKRVHREFAER